MSFERGKYGILYDPRRRTRNPAGCAAPALIAALALVSFLCAKLVGGGGEESSQQPAINNRQSTTSSRQPVPSEGKNAGGTKAGGNSQQSTTGGQRTVSSQQPTINNQRPVPSGGKNAGGTKAGGNSQQSTTNNRQPVPSEGKKAVVRNGAPFKPFESADVKRAREWAASGEQRGTTERVLLQRLLEAEKSGKAKVAIDALEDLKDRPSMADISDGLHRRLGQLNYERLFSGESTPWTAMATVRRGDGRDRIARSRNNTAAVVEKLNPSVNWDRIKPGHKVKVLNYPNAALVVSRRLGTADLSLKDGKFFKRYYVSMPQGGKSEVCPVGGEGGMSVRGWLKQLGVLATVQDRQELEMFLAAGSRIVVTE